MTSLGGFDDGSEESDSLFHDEFGEDDVRPKPAMVLLDLPNKRYFTLPASANVASITADKIQQFVEDALDGKSKSMPLPLELGA